jgi:parallel beta-helix repeat protein
MIKKLIPVLITAVMVLSTITVLTAPTKAQIFGDKSARYGSIQAAIDAAEPGKTITIGDGQTVENVVVNKALTITSAHGPAKSTIYASDPSYPVFTVTAPNVKINDFTIENGANRGSAGVFLNNVINCEISGNVFDHDWYGVHLSSSHCAVTGNYATKNGYAIYLSAADSNVISSNSVSGNGYGVYVDTGNGNTINNNVANNNVGSALYPIYETKGDGIWMINANSNTVQSNTLTSNDAIGMTLYKSSNNVVYNNKIESNVWWGIRIRESSGNVVSRNTIASNGIFNLNLIEAYNNQIYLNNFINQNNNFGGTNSFSTPEKMAYVYNGKQFVNYLGNHWSGYTGTDVNQDGIGDTSYLYDNYPLMTLAENYRIVTVSPSPTVSITKAQLVPADPTRFEWVIANTGGSDAGVAPIAMLYRLANTTSGYEAVGNVTGLYVSDGTTVTNVIPYQGYGWAKVPANGVITIYSAGVVPLDAKWAAYNIAVYDNNGGIYWYFPNWDKHSVLR